MTFFIEKRMFLALGCVIALGGCHDFLEGQRCENMGFDTTFARPISLITVQAEDSSSLNDRRSEQQITSGNQIRAISAFLLQRRDKWRAPVAGVPVGQVELTFFQGESRVRSIHVGPGFLEGQGCGYFFSREISEAETAEILRLSGWHQPLRR
jgi:hypothetical protein